MRMMVLIMMLMVSGNAWANCKDSDIEIGDVTVTDSETGLVNIFTPKMVFKCAYFLTPKQEYFVKQINKSWKLKKTK